MRSRFFAFDRRSLDADGIVRALALGVLVLASCAPLFPPAPGQLRFTGKLSLPDDAEPEAWRVHLYALGDGERGEAAVVGRHSGSAVVETDGSFVLEASDSVGRVWLLEASRGEAHRPGAALFGIPLSEEAEFEGALGDEAVVPGSMRFRHLFSHRPKAHHASFEGVRLSPISTLHAALSLGHHRRVQADLSDAMEEAQASLEAWLWSDQGMLLRVEPSDAALREARAPRTFAERAGLVVDYLQADDRLELLWLDAGDGAFDGGQAPLITLSALGEDPLRRGLARAALMTLDRRYEGAAVAALQTTRWFDEVRSFVGVGFAGIQTFDHGLLETWGPPRIEKPESLDYFYYEDSDGYGWAHRGSAMSENTLGEDVVAGGWAVAGPTVLRLPLVGADTVHAQAWLQGPSEGLADPPRIDLPTDITSTRTSIRVAFDTTAIPTEPFLTFSSLWVDATDYDGLRTIYKLPLAIEPPVATGRAEMQYLGQTASGKEKLRIRFAAVHMHREVVTDVLLLEGGSEYALKQLELGGGGLLDTTVFVRCEDADGVALIVSDELYRGTNRLELGVPREVCP